MNKKGLPMVLWGIIIITVLITIGAGFFLNQNSKGEKCGDDFCDALEKANPNLCPSDCKVANVSATKSEGNSRFGFHPGDANNYSYIHDLGATWSRQGIYIVWEWADANRDGNFKFSDITPPPAPDNSRPQQSINFDKQWANVPEDIELVANITPFRRGGSFSTLAELETYQLFVEKTVERYDGDDDYGCTLQTPDCYQAGDNQYPTTATISAYKKNPIKYWQAGNQLFDTCSKEECRANYATLYAQVMEKTYKGVKEADSASSVLIAGDSSSDLYPAVFQKLNGKYIDIVDFHRFGQHDWYDPQADFDFLKSSLKNSNFDLDKLRFWITETGTYSGEPKVKAGMDPQAYQSERQQASGLIKMHVSALAYGIENIFWAWSITEGFQQGCSIFDYTGLVYDGCDCVDGKYTCRANVGYDKGKGVKKLAYYSYKKLIEIIDGSDWKNVETIQKKDGVYIYQFSKQGQPIWVAWNDNEASRQITIEKINSGQVEVIETIPKYESGDQVTDYSTAFESETKKITGGNISLELSSDSPVFIREVN
jgi:hypothetical protein